MEAVVEEEEAVGFPLEEGLLLVDGRQGDSEEAGGVVHLSEGEVELAIMQQPTIKELTS